MSKDDGGWDLAEALNDPVRYWRVQKHVNSDSVNIGIEEFRPKELARCKRTGEPMFPGLRVMKDGGAPPWHLHSPNWLERLLGISLESKVARAIKKAERMCQKHNAGVDRFHKEAAGL